MSASESINSELNEFLFKNNNKNHQKSRFFKCETLLSTNICNFEIDWNWELRNADWKGNFFNKLNMNIGYC